jgi:pimeloyl-ACP methyl ester carboxylesterase
MNAASLPPALPGARLDLGGVTCYVDGAGPPLVLVHSINAAASAAEVRPLYLHYRATRTVYAPDLPGYGLSDRSKRAYSPRLYTDTLHALADAVHARSGRGPIDALAVSLGSEFLARAASEHPADWGKLALVSPTGLMGRSARRGPAGSVRGFPALHRQLARPAIGPRLFRALTRPGVIRYFLGRTWGSKAIDEELWAYDVLATRAPGAEHAPLHFLAGLLFSADIHTVYEALTQPVWMSHGTRGDFTDYRGRALLANGARWQVSVYEAGALPYFEHTARFIADFDRFLSG